MARVRCRTSWRPSAEVRHKLRGDQYPDILNRGVSTSLWKFARILQNYGGFAISGLDWITISSCSPLEVIYLKQFIEAELSDIFKLHRSCSVYRTALANKPHKSPGRLPCICAARNTTYHHARIIILNLLFRCRK